MDYYVPKFAVVTLPNGKPYRLMRGIHPVPDALANHASANDHGIKPVEEMTDADWRMLGLKKPAVVRAAGRRAGERRGVVGAHRARTVVFDRTGSLMAATSSLTITIDLTKALEEATKALVKRELVVGIPSDAAPRLSGPGGAKEVSNAVIAYVQEFGDDEKNIPARPFLVPGVEAARAAITEGFKRAGAAVLDGNPAGMDNGLAAAGLAAQVSVRKAILDGDFAPLSERTLQARARRQLDSGKASQAETSKAARRELASRAAGELPSSDARPLYDTHSLYGAIAFVVRNKGDKS